MRSRAQAEKPGLRQPEDIPGLPGPGAAAWNGLGGTLLLIHAALVLLAVLLRRAWPPLDNLVGDGTLKAFVIGGLIMQGGMILLPTLLVVTAGRIPPGNILGGKARAGSLILAVTAGVPAAVVLQGVNNLLIYSLVKSGVELPAARLTFDTSDGSLFARPYPVILVIVLMSVIIPAIAEELMFRGVILAALSSGGAAASAIFWQAIAFAFFHGDPLFILPPFLTGLMLAVIRRCSDSLLPCLLAHMSLNITLLILSPLLPQLTADLLSVSSGMASSLLYASLIAACVAAVALVPLLVLISHLQPRRPGYHHRVHVWPADWKFALAFVVLVVTMVVEYN
jgi:membrane protease YdiL (CAAX protease family)